MAVHLKDPRIHVEDGNGNPYVSAKLYVYDAGTTTLQNIWTDSALSVAATNPLISDNDGYFALTYLTSGTYKVRIEQSDSTLIIEADNQDTGIPLGSGVLAIANGGTSGATAAAARTALDVPANSEITTITANVLARLKKTGGELTGDTNNSGTGFFAVPSGTTAERTTPTDGTGMRYNSTTGQLEAFIGNAWVELVALPTGYIDGLGMAHAADTDHDITISTGACRNVQTSNSDDTNMRLTTALTKQIDAAWSVGTNAGGIDGGSVGASTWYHVFIIHDPTNGITDALFSSSFASPTLPANYTKFRRIGSVLTDGSNNILPFLQTGDNFDWIEPSDHKFINTTTSTTGAAVAADVPLGLKVLAKVAAVMDGASPGIGLYFYDPDHYASSTPTIVTAPTTGSISIVTSANAQGGSLTVMTNASSQIGWAGSTATRAVDATIIGWVDPRGRDS